MSTLNVEQQRAVDMALSQPVSTLVVGGPGTGKTHTLTHICAGLLRQGIPASSICLLTFTRKAAQSLELRLQAQIGQASGIMSGTIHSVALHFLRDVGLQFHLVDTEAILAQAVRCVRDDLEEAAGAPCELNVQHIVRSVQDIKNKQDGGKSPHVSGLQANVLLKYAQLKESVNGIDFQDLLEMMHDRMEAFPLLQYVLVDEFQDLNELQLQLLQAMHRRGTRVVAIGDDNQTIYGFRGSSIRTMLDFQRTFAPAQRQVLCRNYRNPPSVVQLSDQILSHFKERIMQTVVPCGGPGTVEYLGNADVVANIQQHREQHQFVLSRCRDQLEQLAARLTAAGIPYVLHAPKHASSQAYYALMTVAHVRANSVLAARPYWHKAREDDDLGLDELLESQDDGSRLACAVLEAVAAATEDGALAALTELDPDMVGMLRQRLQLNPDGTSLLALLDDEHFDAVQSPAAGLELMTVHQAKGLEADAVHVLALHTFDQFGVEDEEGRCQFVAVSRAKQYLALYWDPARSHKVKRIRLPFLSQ